VDYGKKLSLGRWFVRVLMGSALIALLLMYGSSKNVTTSELTKVIASTNVLIIAAVEILDKITDRSTYVRMYAGFYRATGVSPGSRGSFIVSILTPAIVGLGIFALMLYITAGTVSFSLGSYSPAVILWAGALATYTMLPETGDDELIAWAWLGATIATHGQYLHNALMIPGLLQLVKVIIGF